MTGDSTTPKFERWRALARHWLAQRVPPERAVWTDSASPGLFDGDAAQPEIELAAPSRVSPGLIELLARVSCHRDPRRHALMYRALWRSLHGEPRLLQDAADEDVVALTRLAKAVDRASHKMTAFLRFREAATAQGPRFFAWFEPEHDVLRRTAPFFVDRFGTMHWTIATPDGIAHWNRRELAFEDADAALLPPEDDATETLWLAYYEAIFNPARLNVRAMRREMPRRYWSGLPEATLIPTLVAQANERAGRMVETTLDRDVAPYGGMRCGGSASNPSGSRDEVDGCRRCELGRAATQAVAGEGARDAAIVLVGEQPGDEEDLAGRPFVGPAGKLLRELLREAGIDAARVYLTNAVKHFRYEPRGKRRLHKTPAQRHVDACRYWLEAELATLRPAVIVALGATALYALTGRKQAIGEARGQVLRGSDGPPLIATYHPAAVLRAPHASASALRDALLEDLRQALEHVAAARGG